MEAAYILRAWVLVHTAQDVSQADCWLSAHHFRAGGSFGEVRNTEPSPIKQRDWVWKTKLSLVSPCATAMGSTSALKTFVEMGVIGMVLPMCLGRKKSRKSWCILGSTWEPLGASL